MRTPGFTVALIGPDGAGKTTVARRLQRELALPVEYVYMGVNPDSSNYLLPTTRAVHAFRRRRGAKPDTAGPREPHQTDQARPRGLVPRGLRSARSFARLGNRLAEEWHRAVVASVHRRRGSIVVFDRHFFADYYHADVRDGRIGLSPVRRLHGWMLDRRYPKPDLTILLDAPAERLHARKPDATVAWLEQRRRQYLELADVVPGYVVLDADRPLDAVVADAAELIRTTWEARS
jgi:thymidylate kinase